MRHPGDPILAISLEPRLTWRTVKNWIMTGLMVAAFVAITIPLIAILYSLVSRGASVALRSFPEFFTATFRSCRAAQVRAWARRSSARCCAPAVRR